MFYLYYFVFVYECFCICMFFSVVSLCFCIFVYQFVQVSSSSSSSISKQYYYQSCLQLRKNRQNASYSTIFSGTFVSIRTQGICVSRHSESLFLFDRFCRIYTLRNHLINFYSETHLGSGQLFVCISTISSLSALQVSSLKSVFPCEQIFLITRRFCHHLSAHIGAQHRPIYTHFSEERSICCSFHSVVR